MLTLGDIAITALLIAAAAFWWNAQGVRQRALAATRRHCQEMGVQLLDDAVAVRGIWLKRDRNDRLRLRRSYHFEFTSTGNDRYRGTAVLLGTQVESIQLEPHRLN